jgi:hypothetical protein
MMEEEQKEIVEITRSKTKLQTVEASNAFLLLCAFLFHSPKLKHARPLLAVGNANAAQMQNENRTL